jgi:predicted TPR repeat methyltransferase
MADATDDGEILTYDRAMDMVRAYIGSRNLKPAIDLLEQIIEVVKDQSEPWNYLAVAKFHAFGPAETKKVLERAIEAMPTDSGLYNNLGNANAELGEVQAAADAYERAIELDARNADAFCNLSSVVKHAGNTELAERLLRTALSVNPDFGLAHQNLAKLLLDDGRAKDAIDHFWKATVLLPRANMPMQLLVLAYWHAGMKSEAVDLARKWRDEKPDDPQARHVYAAMSGTDVPEQAPADYVTQLFDRFANSFDAKLDNLGYRAPEIIAEAVTAAVGDGTTGLSILDAGAGTGKCGKYLKPHAAWLVGVDLSSQMLAKAERLNLYDELVCAELTAFVTDHPSSYDIIASADTLCYFGRLDEFASAAHAALKPGGSLVFTVEGLDDENQDYRLAVHGRYEHSEAYVRRVMKTAGLPIASLKAEVLRLENAQPVIGFAVTATRPV